jgi:levanbiose-producing levanase
MLHVYEKNEKHQGVTSGTYEIEVEIEMPEGSQVSEFGFNVHVGGIQKTVVGYKPNKSQIFVDRSVSGLTDFSSLISTRHEMLIQTENNRI